MTLTKGQRAALMWAKRKYTDARVPPYVFRNYRTIANLLKAGFIELWSGYGEPMYRFTNRGLDALEQPIRRRPIRPKKNNDPALTRFQVSLLREASVKGVFSSYMVPNKSIEALAVAGLINANPKASYFKTSRYFDLTETGKQYLRELEEKR